MASDKRQTAGPVIAALDVGTSKIGLVVAQAGPAGIDIRALVSVPSSGVRKGVVIDVDRAATAIAETVAAAREQAKMPIREVIAVITGSHLKGIPARGGVDLPKGRVTEPDIERVLETIHKGMAGEGRELIHVLPTDFSVDGRDGIKDPVGMPGSRLDAQAHVIMAASEPIERLIRACNKAGVQVNDLVFQGIAAAEAALSTEERDMGTALIDIGGGTTDIAVYRDGWVVHTAVIPVGGMHFTNDLSVGLRIPFSEAERIKKHHGSLSPMTPDDDDEIDVVGLDGEVRKVARRLVKEILHLRAEELLELILGELRLSTVKKDSVTGIVFTGGTALLQGFERFAEPLVSMPVRLGVPERAAGSAAPLAAIAGQRGLEGMQLIPGAATLGLALYGALPALRESSADTSGPRDAGSLGGTVSGFFRKIFRKA